MRQGSLAGCLLACGLGLLSAPNGVSAATESRPNLVVILADDLGWPDARCYGSDWIDTPNLDRMAREGLRFTQAYAPAPICSATRAALLTGRSPARLGFEFVTKREGDRPPANHPLQSPPYTLDLPLEEVTFAEALGGSGYHTVFLGKWHVARHYQTYLGWSPTHGPRQQGFAEAVEGFGSHPWGDAKGKPRVATEPGVFPADALTDAALEVFRRSEEDRKPFLLYYCPAFVHTPVRTRASWLTKKYAARLPTGAPAKLADYAAFVEVLDHQVGRLLDDLKRRDLERNTVVVFTSDNGGHPEFNGNAPLRGSKWNLYEGGIRVPFLVRWPGRVPAGAVCETPVVGMDLFPTLCDLGGTSLSGRPLDGRSLVPWLKAPDAGGPLARPLVWHFPYYHPEKGYGDKRAAIGVGDGEVSQTRPVSAWREGEWKLLYFYEGQRTELYHLGRDPAEQQDLAGQEPRRAAAMRTALMDYLKRVGARLPVRRER